MHCIGVCGYQLYWPKHSIIYVVHVVIVVMNFCVKLIVKREGVRVSCCNMVRNQISKKITMRNIQVFLWLFLLSRKLMTRLLCFLFFFCFVNMEYYCIVLQFVSVWFRFLQLHVHNMKKRLFVVSTIYHMTCFQARGNHFNFKIDDFLGEKFKNLE